jgi:putative phage-type endonuclease
VNVNFVVVELEQGTSQWLAWRHNGIGASEASTVMRWGESRSKTASKLLQKKRGPVILNSFKSEAMALGTKLEPEARNLYNDRTGKNVRPVCVQSSKYDWLRASLDGLSTNHDMAVEIKCGATVYRSVSQSRSVPDYYYGQVQHILAATGLDSLDFWCYWPGQPPLLLPVERNDTYIERLLSKEFEFWTLVKQATKNRRIVLIKMGDTGNPEEDAHRLQSTMQLMLEFPGQDSVQLEITGHGQRTRLEMPLVTTSFCPELEEKLAALIGDGQARIMN